MFARISSAVAARLAMGGDRGSHTTEIVIGITIVVAITAVVGPILTDTFTDAAKSIDLGITK
ncbi:hypothetical protein [Nocardiopsis composta]|uniref:Uncharacterized protein n=1 Tax=Nocardiopsis composta TaxID=157465 RepID=A0A7W8QSA6_9ACTN|nr:hypothetical protein [Nocardiopsis composta]MBB5435209.1 hypothetical protein [Nocardiopsis composta]